MSEFECPNGHPFPRVVEVKCAECDASVACEPVARGMAESPKLLAARLSFDERLQRLERIVGELADEAAGGFTSTGDELVRLQARVLRLEAAHLRAEARVDRLADGEPAEGGP